MMEIYGDRGYDSNMVCLLCQINEGRDAGKSLPFRHMVECLPKVDHGFLIFNTGLS
jgi:hypothetical protein